MEIELTKETLDDMEYIISHFAEHFSNEVTNITALAYCLQVLINAQKELEEILNEES